MTKTSKLKLVLGLGLFGGVAIQLAVCGLVGADSREHEKDHEKDHERDQRHRRHPVVQLGPRPFYLLERMTDSPLKRQLEECAAETEVYTPRLFSIGHRGAALMFPEHTRESYMGAARMGAGIIECDVSITRDLELVCRHSQCDLHTTTNILAIPELAAKCSEPFSPAEYDAVTGALTKPASAKCCTTDVTLPEFLSLCGKMDSSNPGATTVEAYLGGTPDFRTDLYNTCATLLSHAQSIKLIDSLGANFTPELKDAAIDLDGDGKTDLTQSDFALKMIDEYRTAGISPRRVYAQSFNFLDVLIWVNQRPAFGKQAVFLDPRDDKVDPADPSADGLVPSMQEVADAGVRIIAPPMWYLLTTDADDQIVPSKYAKSAKEAGLEIITWTTERSGRIVQDVLPGPQAYYYQSTLKALHNDGDILTTIHVLAKEVGVLGIFSDWAATTTFYANCMGMK